MFISDKEFVGGNIYNYGSDMAVRILMFAMLFSFINALFGFTLVVLNKQIKLMYANAACVLLNLIGNLIVIPYWGFRGAAITSVVSALFILIITGWIVKKALGFSISFNTLGKIIISSLIMGLAVWSGYFLMADMWFIWQIALLVPLGGAVYVLMILKTKAITPEMWRLLKKS